eukprot:jgi/Picsp_1/372/NSC_00370-R1_---NA---
MASLGCFGLKVGCCAGQHHSSKYTQNFGLWDLFSSKCRWSMQNCSNKSKRYKSVIRALNNIKDNEAFDNVASLVPDFPRLFDRPDLLPKQFTSPVSGFDVNAETKLLFPDIVNIDNFYTAAIAIAFVVAFVSFEGIELLSSYQSEKVFERLAEKASRKKRSSSEPGTDQKDQKEEYIQFMKRERKRGLGWLAIVTAIAVWSTGILNNPNPLTP